MLVLESAEEWAWQSVVEWAHSLDSWLVLKWVLEEVEWMGLLWAQQLDLLIGCYSSDLHVCLRRYPRSE